MSIRIYNGPHSDRGGGGGPSWPARLPLVFALITVGLQIVWPLASGGGRVTLTLLIVTAFFLASLTHAWQTRGRWWTVAWAVISLAFGLGVEVLGTRTGVPFGSYSYAPEVLGPTVAGIPAIIPMAWAMMSYPALLVGRRLGRSGLATVLIAGWALASWDLFLDPQMVGEGYWTWVSPSPEIPGVAGIPALNYLGWLVAAVVLMTLLNRLPDAEMAGRRQGGASRRRLPEGVPGGLYLWTWLGGVVANAFFLGRPSVALVGGVAMGLVAVPYAFRLTERQP